jgi:esterase/lipase
MKIIITEKQHKLINEVVGVPDSILDAAEELYDIFLEKIKTINTKKDEYIFKGNVEIEMGGIKKINIERYVLTVETKEFDEYDDEPKIASMGMLQDFIFDRNKYMKRVIQTTEAMFRITYIVNPNWLPEELYNEFNRDKDNYVSSLAHELKHFYDKQSKKIDLMGYDAEYQAIMTSPRFGIPIVDSQFLNYLYYTTIAENLVRPTEIASMIKSKKITKSQFKDFLREDKTYQKLTKIKNFTYEDLVRGISENMDRVDEIMLMVDENPDIMTTEQKVDKVLNLVYFSLGNEKMDIFENMLTRSDDLSGLFGFMNAFGISPDPKINKIKEQFFNHISKYQNNVKQYFKDEIKNFHIVADKMIRKIAKLYSIAEDDNPVSESIIDWDLHSKLMSKQYGEINFETNFKKK